MFVEQRLREHMATGNLSAATTEAIHGMGPTVAGYLRILLRDEEDAADALSVWAESVWRGLPSFEWRSSFKTWAYRLAYTSAMKLRRRAHHRREVRLPTSKWSALVQEVRTSTLSVDRRQQRLDQLRAHLSAQERMLLFLRVDQRLSWNEVAAVLSTRDAAVTAQSLRKRFERLKNKIAGLARKRSCSRVPARKRGRRPRRRS
jgi:RNA polymerase sigma-70 factor (ECF subfamily)